MFLFSRKTKTPISTYSDSYRAPTSIKEVYKDPPLWAWEANKFVTPVSRGCKWDGRSMAVWLGSWHLDISVFVVISCFRFCFVLISFMYLFTYLSRQGLTV
jgi:hypothetical protein